MVITEIIQNLVPDKVVIISQSELHELISQSEIILEKDTLLCGFIRIISYSNQVIIQEQTNKNELLIRLVDSVEKAEKFVQERLNIYDKMWDGCGCRVHYFK